MNILEVDSRHPLRPTVERHIVSVYRRGFGAEVSLFAPRLFAAVDAAGQVHSAAGIRSAEERFHCECYLGQPAEHAAASVLARPVDRRELLEFTTLACGHPGGALEFVSHIVRFGRGQGCRIALFTGTAPLRMLLLRAGLEIITIATAERARVSDPNSWGRYYSFDPRVCIAPDSLLVPRRLRAPCFRSARAATGQPSAAGGRPAIHA